MASSSCLRKSESLKVLILPSRFLPLARLIQLTACSCGSMASGKRDALVVRMPFWIESSSLGNPSLAHCPISTSLVSSDSSLNGVVTGMLRSLMSSSQSWYVIWWRKSYVKPPAYERKEEQSMQSPTSRSRRASSSCISFVQRVRSLSRPAMRRSAATKRRSMRSAFSLRSVCSAVFSLNCERSCSSCSPSAFSSALIFASSFSDMRSVFSACATAWRFGLTMRATAL
mmetsp:Transcript_1271/g.4714  ORF Transcript_1271/g.4714 Transcript_1271/m.4714 type:complete len:228 (+) Transcript_1271:3296-3979(+)